MKHQAKREMIEAIGTPRERIMQAFYAATKVNVNAQYGVLGLKVSRLHWQISAPELKPPLLMMKVMS